MTATRDFFDKETVLALAARHVCPGRIETMKLLGMQPVFGRREGHYVWDLDGRRLFDVHINGGTFSLGHRHPELVETLREALDTWDIGNHHLPSGPRAHLAAELARTAPGPLPYVVFAASGSEANDVAIRSARRATGRRRIVTVVGSYHGHTGLSMAASDVETARYFHSEGAPSDFTQVPWNDLDVMKETLSRGDVAAVLLETIPATLGFPMPAPGYLPGVKALCEEFGALFVADEVQTGLGRTGRMWAIEGYGVEPDVLVTGKGLSGGLYPMSAVLLSERAGAWLHEKGWGHVSTFGGAEVGCLVSLKVLEILQRPGVLENVVRASDALAARFDALRERDPFLVEVRRNGLVMALRFDHELAGPLMTAAGYECGLWAFFAGFDRSVLQMKPGILLEDAHIDEIATAVERAMALARERLAARGA